MTKGWKHHYGILSHILRIYQVQLTISTIQEGITYMATEVQTLYLGLEYTIF